MTLYLIGTGLGNEEDLTLAAVRILKEADSVYFECYTSVNSAPLTAYEKLIGKKIAPASRTVVEEQAEELLIRPAKEKDIVLLIPGDPLAATTHFSLLSSARELGVPVKVLHNASVFTAIAETGLSLYKFGRIATLPFPRKGTVIDSPYGQLAANSAAGLHTLLLLDLEPPAQPGSPGGRFMSISEAIAILQSDEERLKKGCFTEDTTVLAAAALGTVEQVILAGKPAELKKQEITAFPRCLIVPGTLSHHEEEALALLRC